MEKGFTIWFTGVPASGKSTIGTEVEKILRGRGLKVENLDADDVRQNLSPDLKWSKADRDLNTKRLTFIAKLLSRNGVAVIIAAAASYREFRDRARREIDNFVEAWVNCSLEECKQRDPKGLYARGERGEVNDIEGWHQPYEEPLNAELVLETEQYSVDECAAQVIAKLEELGYIVPSDDVYSAEDEAKVEERLRGLGYI
ncbi:MAG: adenylyl-sulfate kinase [Armatimonadetes bacterium CG2_30_59_28]|nr:adenylyl-sulfate kinase [Armatimonadota bacterium]OIO91248.1 MAG: adenylyl-sulfate kinase [Armatimonadetes bacterium CG2_30_59_28]PIU64097.1 MAG: adenylyl-sulfate kinase [Armatimonadetes bacterium CG07_land_8_20_14_0_80_59_28]PIX43699.1 MAG: adenylyl-sulfate kinase [Armatimonadetes bacterium CG_4_8_14_3_um_filter_58_9]PIY47532.1 MAG: adenylyl-sulfate kinase [Armatimonadetes bacterium CG_4_10_14_3_um_filter_59_10]